MKIRTFAQGSPTSRTRFPASCPGNRVRDCPRGYCDRRRALPLPRSDPPRAALAPRSNPRFDTCAQVSLVDQSESNSTNSFAATIFSSAPGRAAGASGPARVASADGGLPGCNGPRPFLGIHRRCVGGYMIIEVSQPDHPGRNAGRILVAVSPSRQEGAFEEARGVQPVTRDESVRPGPAG